MSCNKEKLKTASHMLRGLNLLVFESRLAQLCGYHCEILNQLVLRQEEKVGGLLGYMMMYDEDEQDV